MNRVKKFYDRPPSTTTDNIAELLSHIDELTERNFDLTEEVEKWKQEFGRAERDRRARIRLAESERDRAERVIIWLAAVVVVMGCWTGAMVWKLWF